MDTRGKLFSTRAFIHESLPSDLRCKNINFSTFHRWADLKERERENVAVLSVSELGTEDFDFVSESAGCMVKYFGRETLSETSEWGTSVSSFHFSIHENTFFYKLDASRQDEKRKTPRNTLTDR